VKGALVNHVVRNVKKMVPAWRLPGAVRFNDALAAAGARPARRRVGPRRHRGAAVHRRHHRREQGRGAAAPQPGGQLLQAEAWYQPALKKIPPGEQIVTVCALPLYHIFGFNTNMMLGMRMGGCNILIPTRATSPAC
jgi:long-chain acyl-CoA synthetase